MASKELQGFGKSLDSLGGAVSTFAKVGLAAVATAGVALVGGLGASIGAAMDFEAAMSAVAAVAGGTDADLKALSDTALKLGQDTTLSGIGATDAARAMRELAAAGMSVEDIVGGGALGALRLASAGGIDVARAAEIAAMALAGFGLAGTEAAAVADLFAGAANSSAISVEDIAETMKYVAPIAQTMGLSIEEVTATIAALGNQGIKGSQAGTSLRSMIVSLAKPSKEATKVMNGLGLSFFDTNGEMKDLAGISQELKGKLSGLTDKQRASALATLFGNEALTAATVLYGEGADGINKWLKEVTEGSTAAEVGAKRNDNLKGSIEALKSSFETAQIVLGKAFLPALKGIVDQMALGVSAAIPLIEAWGPRLVAGIQSAIGVLTQFGGYVASAIGAVVGAFKALQSGEITMGQFVGGIKTLISTVLGDIGGLLGKVGAFLAPYFAAIGSAITAALPVVATEIGKLASAFGSWIQSTAIPYLATNLPLWLGAIVGWVTSTAIPAITTAVGAVGSAFGGWISGTAIPYLTTNLPLWKNAIVTWVTDTAIPEITTAVGNIGSAFGGWIAGTAIPYLTTNLPLWKNAIVTFITADVIPTVTGWVVGIGNAMGGWISGTAIPYLTTNLPLWKNAIVNFITADVIPTVTGAVVGVGNAITGWVQGTAIPVVKEKLVEWGTAITGGIASAATVVKEKSDSDIPPALNSGIDKAARESNTHMETWNEGIISFLNGLPAKLDAILVPAGHSLGKWIVKAMPAVTMALGNFIEAITVVIVNLPATLGKLTLALVPPMWHWIRDAVGPALIAFGNFNIKILFAIAQLGAAIGKALDGIKETLIKTAVAIGVGIVDGIIEGILGGQGRVQSAAKSLGGSATEGAKKELQEKSPSKVFREIGKFAAEGLALGLEDGKAEAAKKAAEVASAVSKAVTDVLGAMRALSAFNAAKDSPTGEQMGWFGHLTSSLIATMGEAAANFKEEALKQTSAFADTVGKVGGSVKNAVEGLAAIGTAKWAEVSPTGSALGWFTHLMTSLVQNFVTAAKGFDEDGLKAASGLADTAGKIGGSISATLGGLAALASADWAKTSPSGSAMAWFSALVANLVQTFATAAAAFEVEVLASANRFAETAGKVAAVIGPAIAGFKELATIVAPSQTSIDQLVAGIRYLVQKFGEMATIMDDDGVKHMSAFAAATNTALGAAKTGTELFKSFDKLVIPSAKAIDDLANGIRYIVGKFRDMATMLTGEGLAAMSAFATTAGQVLGAAKTGTDLFASMEKLAVPSAAAIDYLLGSMGYVITQTQAIANGIGTEGLAAAQKFATGSLNVFTTIKTALEQFAKLEAFKDIPTDILRDLFKALEGAVDFSGQMVGRADEILQNSIEFLDKMANAALNFAKGEALGGSGAPLTAPAGVGGGGGGGERGPAGDVYTINVQGDVYDGASFQDKVVSVLSDAERRGRT